MGGNSSKLDKDLVDEYVELTYFTRKEISMLVLFIVSKLNNLKILVEDVGLLKKKLKKNTNNYFLVKSNQTTLLG